ncbi:MAG TPA: trigger factor [Candidatus Acidoferrales bacterium]|nr:trigger factor [Candidatus Acidoferrales bacterium]
MALVEGCKHSLEISVPVPDVESETGRVVGDVMKRAKLPGFRPGKVPAALIRKQFAGDIRQKVLEALVPKFLQKQLEAENLNLAGSAEYSDVHFHDGEPLRFKATFEVVPEIELGEYKDVEVPYQDPAVTDEDVARRIDELRNQKADYVNVDPRPVEDGDFAVVSLESISGVEGEPVKTEEMQLEIAAAETFEAFTVNLRGLSPGEEKEFEVVYPEEYGSAKLAGKTVKFHATLKGIRKKELPELNDEFAQDLGDYRTVDELREAVRKSIFGQRQYEAQQQAKKLIVDKVVGAHDFPVPEVFVDRQIKNRVEQAVRSLAADGLDPKSLKLDWNKVKEAQHDEALREVKASMLLSKIAEREAIHATRDEVDREVEKVARQQRKPVAAVQMEFEKDGTLGRIASHIQTDKTLGFLFEHARKTA